MRQLLAVAFLLLSTCAWSESVLEKQKEQDAQQSNSHSDIPKSITHPAVTITVSPTVTANTQPAEKANREQEESGWESITARSTAVLALITGALAFFTFMLWRSTSDLVRKTEATTKKHERAYIYGGGPYGDRIDGQPINHTIRNNNPKNFTDEKRLTLQNYGRTPGYIYEVEYGFCKLADLPRHRKASWILEEYLSPLGLVKKVEFPSFVVPPTLGATWVSYRQLKVVSSEHINEVFIGRIRYRDIFGVEHHSTFKYWLTPDGFSEPIDDGLGDYD